MNRTWSRVGARGVALAAAWTVIAVAPAAQAPVAVDLPDGPGAAVVRARCLSCHEADLIAGQRLTEAGWGREIDKMVRWGARVPDTDRETLLSYLTTHFPPQPSSADASPDQGGEAVFSRACLSCHGVDLVESQRLSPAGWTREIDKMVRWGAVVSDAEKAALAAWLSARYPDF